MPELAPQHDRASVVDLVMGQHGLHFEERSAMRAFAQPRHESRCIGQHAGAACLYLRVLENSERIERAARVQHAAVRRIANVGERMAAFGGKRHTREERAIHDGDPYIAQLVRHVDQGNLRNLVLQDPGARGVPYVPIGAGVDAIDHEGCG